MTKSCPVIKNPAELVLFHDVEMKGHIREGRSVGSWSVSSRIEVCCVQKRAATCRLSKRQSHEGGAKMDISTSETKEVVQGLGKALNDENYEAARRYYRQHEVRRPLRFPRCLGWNQPQHKHKSYRRYCTLWQNREFGSPQ